MDWLMVLFGFGVGALVGATGMGGGSLMTPLLILLFGVKPVVAVGTDLLYAAITKTVGGWRHLRQGTVDLSIAGWMAIGSVPGALGGVWLLERLHASVGDGFDELVILFVAIALLITGLATLGRAVLLPQAAERDTIDMGRRHKAAAVGLGVSVGLILGITSAGSGALIAAGLIIMFRLTPMRVVGTDVFHAAVLLWAAGLAHLASGNVDYGLMGTLLLGSVPGVWIGSGMAVKLPAARMRWILGVVLTACGVALLAKAGAGIPAVGIAVLVTAAVALVVARRAARKSRGSAVPATSTEV